MQLTAYKGGHMVVDFYPVKFHTGEIHNRLMFKVVTFMGKTQSSYINREIFNVRLILVLRSYGYQVTDESMLLNSLTLLSHYLLCVYSSLLFVLLGVNLTIELLNSSLVDVLEKRKETIEQVQQQLN